MQPIVVIVDNKFVLSASLQALTLIAEQAGLQAKRIEAAAKRGREHMAVWLGTHLSNSKDTRDVFAAGKLAVELPWEALTPEQQAAHKQASPQDEPKASSKSVDTKSAKDWLRELFSKPNARYTLAELVALTGKTEVNIRTMLSDLRSSKYAGKLGVFVTKSERIGQKVYYSRA